MTGLYPYTDGILTQNGPFIFLRKKNTTLAQVLGESGYDTHAITSSIQSSEITGIQLGFETFDSIDVRGQSTKAKRRVAKEVTDLAVAWLQKRTDKDKPFFLWLHYLDPHHPYKVPPSFGSFFSEEEPQEEGETKHYRFDEKRSKRYPLTDGDLHRLIIRYDQEVLYTDHALSALFENGLRDFLGNTAVVITADHGEALGNHGIITHNELYQSILHVPLLIRLPGEEPSCKEIDTPVMLVDIFPTVLDLVSVPLQVPVRGVSLAPLFRGKALTGERFRLSEYPNCQAVFLNDIKLINRESGTELYDIGNDPLESRNLSGTMKDSEKVLAEALRVKLQKGLRGAEGEENLPEITPGMVEELEALGY